MSTLYSFEPISICPDLLCSSEGNNRWSPLYLQNWTIHGDLCGTMTTCNRLLLFSPFPLPLEANNATITTTTFTTTTWVRYNAVVVAARHLKSSNIHIWLTYRTFLPALKCTKRTAGLAHTAQDVRMNLALKWTKMD